MLKNFKQLFFSSLIIMIFIFTAIPVKADLYDDIEILTEEEKGYIEDQLSSYQEKHKYNVIIRFLDGPRDIELEMEDWYNKNYGNLEYKNSVIYAINVDQRETLIKAYDRLSFVDFYNDTGIVGNTASYLTSEDYKGSIDCLLEELPTVIFKQKFFILAAIYGINLLIFNLILFFAAKTKGQKDTTTINTYMNSSSRITGRRDVFLRKSVTKTKKSSSSSGGGGGHSSGSGGRGHF